MLCERNGAPREELGCEADLDGSIRELFFLAVRVPDRSGWCWRCDPSNASQGGDDQHRDHHVKPSLERQPGVQKFLYNGGQKW